MKLRENRKIPVAVAGTLAGVLVILVALWGLIALPEADPVPDAPDRPPAEQLLAETRDAARERLETYGWVDREKGVVRIPVAVAMEKLLEERR